MPIPAIQRPVQSVVIADEAQHCLALHIGRAASCTLSIDARLSRQSPATLPGPLENVVETEASQVCQGTRLVLVGEIVVDLGDIARLGCHQPLVVTEHAMAMARCHTTWRTAMTKDARHTLSAWAMPHLFCTDRIWLVLRPFP